MKEICSKQDCVGCGACLSACTKDAIAMQSDKLGFLYPVIDQNKCIDCGLCVKSCFNNHKPSFYEPIKSSVGHAVMVEEQLSSTSGGIASVMMRYILTNNGIVYGCSGENAWDVKHIRIERPDDINRLKGSKYVQSYMGLTYKSVKVDLLSGRNVLFIGTPCQVAGLKTYLRGKVYDNLYTIDFVCHGVPSQQILIDAIRSKNKEEKQFSLINRVKEGERESKYTLRLKDGDRIVCDDTYPSKGYITGFLCGLYYRENCYQCQFARRERVSDITLGDFWDRYDQVEGLPNKKAGLSMIIVNTEAGKTLLAKCSDLCVQIPWKYDDFINRNRQLKQPIKRHPKRDCFENLYLTCNFETAIDKSLDKNLQDIKKGLLINRLKLMIFKIPFLGKKLLKIN